MQHPDSGAPTAPDVVSLRGPDPSEAMVTLDGQQLNDGNTGDIDLSQFAVPAFNSVNVTEGLGPTDLEGSNTFGGAVNFVSLRPTQDDHFAIFELGGLVRHAAKRGSMLTGTIGKLGYALAGDNFQQAGQVNQTDYVVPVEQSADLLRSADQNAKRRTVRFSRISARRSPRSWGSSTSTTISRSAPTSASASSRSANNRDESSALNGIAEQSDLRFQRPRRGVRFLGRRPGEPNEVAESGLRRSRRGQAPRTSRRAFARTTPIRTLARVGNALGRILRPPTTTWIFKAAASRRTTWLTWTRATTRGCHGGAASTAASSRSAGTRAKRRWPASASTERLSRASTRIIFRGSQQLGSNVRFSGGLYDADYSTRSVTP